LGQVIDLAALVTLDPPRAAGAPGSRGRQAALQPGTAVAVVECPLPLAGDEGVGVAHQAADAPVTLPLPGAGWKLSVPGHQQRSEERRVGKECRSRWSSERDKKRIGGKEHHSSRLV